MFLLLCNGVAGVSWSITTVASLTSEGAESDGAAVGESAETDSGSDTITVFSEGDEMSMSEYETQGGKGSGGKDWERKLLRRGERRVRRQGWRE